MHLLLELGIPELDCLVILATNLRPEGVLIDHVLDRVLLVLAAVDRDHVECLVSLLLQLQPRREHDFRGLLRSFFVLNVRKPLGMVVLESFVESVNRESHRVLTPVILVHKLNIT